MNLTNSYATLSEFKTWKEINAAADAARDEDIKLILEAVSRYIDDRTGRSFYPRFETRYYSVPTETELLLDDDLLSVSTLTNGDGVVIASTEYNVLPRNKSPHYGIKIKDLSTSYWQSSITSGDDYVISLSGFWGYHSNYSQRAWTSSGTLGAAVSDTSTLSITMSTGHSVAVGKLYKVDTEIFGVTAVSDATVTLKQRGDNGSTAATHTSGTTVYEWQVMTEIKTACLIVAHNVYARRFGENVNSTATVTGAGVVITPRDVPQFVESILCTLKRMY